MFNLDYKSKMPIYEQIKEGIKSLIMSGAIAENEKIPSVREVAVNMAINPNTVQKAYKELENEGFIYSQRAKGYYASGTSNNIEEKRKTQLFLEIEKCVKELEFIGISEKEITEKISKIYKGEM